MKITINTVEIDVPKKVLTYEDLIGWKNVAQKAYYTVAYFHHKTDSSGTLYVGQSVRLKKGMNFTVMMTNSA